MLNNEIKHLTLFQKTNICVSFLATLRIALRHCNSLSLNSDKRMSITMVTSQFDQNLN